MYPVSNTAPQNFQSQQTSFFDNSIRPLLEQHSAPEDVAIREMIHFIDQNVLMSHTERAGNEGFFKDILDSLKSFFSQENEARRNSLKKVIADSLSLFIRGLDPSQPQKHDEFVNLMSHIEWASTTAQENLLYAVQCGGGTVFKKMETRLKIIEIIGKITLIHPNVQDALSNFISSWVNDPEIRIRLELAKLIGKVQWTNRNAGNNIVLAISRGLFGTEENIMIHLLESMQNLDFSDVEIQKNVAEAIYNQKFGIAKKGVFLKISELIKNVKWTNFSAQEQIVKSIRNQNFALEDGQVDPEISLALIDAIKNIDWVIENRRLTALVKHKKFGNDPAVLLELARWIGKINSNYLNDSYDMKIDDMQIAQREILESINEQIFGNSLEVQKALVESMGNIKWMYDDKILHLFLKIINEEKLGNDSQILGSIALILLNMHIQSNEIDSFFALSFIKDLLLRYEDDLPEGELKNALDVIRQYRFNPVTVDQVISEFTVQAIKVFESLFNSLPTYEKYASGYRAFTRTIIKCHIQDFLPPTRSIPKKDPRGVPMPHEWMILQSFNSGEVRQFINSVPYKEVGLKTLILKAIDVIEANSKSKKIITLSGEEKEPFSKEDVSASKIQNWFQAVQAYSRSVQGTQFRHLTRIEEGTSSVKRESDIQKKVETISTGMGIEDGSLDEIIRCALGDPLKLHYDNVKLFQKDSRKNIFLLIKLLKSTAIKPDMEQSFLRNFINFKFDLVHYTSVKTPHKRLLSLNTLLSSPAFSEAHRSWKDSNKFKYDQISGTPRIDMERLGDSEFVFFHLQPPEQARKMKSRFGEYFYAKSVAREDFEDKKILITLTDTAVNSYENRFKKSELIFNAFVGHKVSYLPRCDIEYAKEVLAAWIKEAYDRVVGTLDQNQVFVGTDVLTALGLCSLSLYETINRKYSDALREVDGMIARLPEGYLIIDDIIKNMEEFLMSNLEDHVKLNAIFNSWIRPIVKVPVGVSV